MPNYQYVTLFQIKVYLQDRHKQLFSLRAKIVLLPVRPEVMNLLQFPEQPELKDKGVQPVLQVLILIH